MDDTNYSFVHFYIKSKSQLEFLDLIKDNHDLSKELTLKLYSEFEALLKSCNIHFQKEELPPETINFNKEWLTVYYNIYKKIIAVNYNCADVKNLIHPQIEHFEVKNTNQATTEFHIDNTDKHYQIFSNKEHNGTYSESDYHMLQGQFAMRLLNVLTDTNEKAWLGTFHASTISNNQNAIMLIGESGKGKSTLAALLAANGFNLVADDFTPVLANDNKIYSFPAAISIKEGSLNALNPYFKELEKSPTFKLNINKGNIRYLATPQNNKKLFNCSKIIIVNYSKDVKTSLEIASLERALNILIPDSWISPEPENAHRFLDWLESLDFYELHYSNTNEAVFEFEKLFNLDD